MAASINKIFIAGILGKDPELRYTQNQTPVANVSIATNEYKKNSDGTKTELTEWHNVVIFGVMAEKVAEQLSKGSFLTVEGKIQTKKWENNEGKTMYKTEIVAKTLGFKGNKTNNNNIYDSGSAGNVDPNMYDMGNASIPDLSDIPF